MEEQELFYFLLILMFVRPEVTHMWRLVPPLHSQALSSGTPGRNHLSLLTFCCERVCDLDVHLKLREYFMALINYSKISLFINSPSFRSSGLFKTVEINLVFPKESQK